MALFKVQYKSIDGRMYEKPVVMRDDEIPVISNFLDKVYDVGHSILSIQNFELVTRKESDQ